MKKPIIRLAGTHVSLTPRRTDYDAIELYTRWLAQEDIAGYINKNYIDW